jgi:hypothetical protein
MDTLKGVAKKLPLPKQEAVTTTLNIDTVKQKVMRGDLTKEERNAIKKERKPTNKDFFEVKRKTK